MKAARPPIVQDVTTPLVPEKMALIGTGSERRNIDTKTDIVHAPTPTGTKRRGVDVIHQFCFYWAPFTVHFINEFKLFGYYFNLSILSVFICNFFFLLQILQRQIIPHSWQRALTVPGEVAGACGRKMARQQGRVWRMGGQGAVRFSRHGPEQGTREIPVVRTRPAVQFWGARVRGDMNLQRVWFEYVE